MGKQLGQAGSSARLFHIVTMEKRTHQPEHNYESTFCINPFNPGTATTL